MAPDERIALITRPHALTFWGFAVGRIVGAVVLLAGALLVEQGQILPVQLVQLRPIVTLVFLLLFLLAAGSVVLGWLRWRAHEIVVTDRRVIRISGILTKDVIDYSLDAITDLRLRQ